MLVMLEPRLSRHLPIQYKTAIFAVFDATRGDYGMKWLQ